MPDCPTCDRPLDAHDRHIRFTLPTPVLELPDREHTPGTWMSHQTARESVMMQVPGAGPFVRVLLPVQLDGGYQLTFGAWLAIHRDDLQRAFAVWWEPGYVDLRLDGFFANTVEPWGLFPAPVTATVRDPDATPYVTASADPLLAEVLSSTWPHDEVLAHLPA
ncbi:hypothetical protein [Kribbella shirazensis]|uniref:DUF2199 domain-containing protein n=1 Tax=Kribbella shirazensis TaxID=1105143 RepID=A0A7X5V7G2_9ACTN|nr:hypothetical protein [Kribbella shirazensis]NIK56007.1 hypothetical protein [Kribbella shirazensis]